MLAAIESLRQAVACLASTHAATTNRRHPDIFKPDEAAAYLGLPSTESLKKLAKENILKGYDGWTNYHLYHREDLDRAARVMFGRDKEPTPTHALRLPR